MQAPASPPKAPSTPSIFARLLGVAALATTASLAYTGCAQDEILEVPTTCGDGQVRGAEECDVDSPGCNQCKLVSGWRCPGNECKTTCGDGIVAGEEQCDPPNTETKCDTSCRNTAKDEACDMNGIWIVRQTDFSIDTVLSQVQTSSNWFIVQVKQTGEDWVVEKGVFCGIRVTGSVTVDLTDAGTKGLMYRNFLAGGNGKPARAGTFKEIAGGKCQFDANRHYFVRGGDDSLLPSDYLSKPTLASLPPLPKEPNPQAPTGNPAAAGAEDTDNDGQPGVAWQISGNSNGLRNTIQRDWNEYHTDDKHSVLQNVAEFTVRSDFANEEEVLHVTQCPALGCGILTAGSNVAQNLDGRAVFRYLGKDLNAPAVKALLENGDFGNSKDDDLKMCKRLREQLPHDPSKE